MSSSWGSLLRPDRFLSEMITKIDHYRTSESGNKQIMTDHNILQDTEPAAIVRILENSDKLTEVGVLHCLRNM